MLSVDRAPRQNRTVFSALQERRIARNACGAENSGAGGANRTLIGRLTLGEPYRATTLPLSYTGWSRRADSNRHLGATRAPFFPLNYFDLKAGNRIRTGVHSRFGEQDPGEVQS